MFMFSKQLRAVVSIKIFYYSTWSISLFFFSHYILLGSIQPFFSICAADDSGSLRGLGVG